jgi:Mandelate racemase / muconate lactonizing enzyme, N-terminal domain
MAIRKRSTISRRSVLKRVAATAMLGPLFQATRGTMSAQVRQGGGINRNSSPSALKITDIRACRIAANYDYPIIKVYTNQDIYGLGEVRDAGVEGMALMLKPFLVGQDPTDIEGLLRRVRPYANHGRNGGGYSAIDIALHDITGKVYGVPAWRLLSSHKVRDKVRIYADTTDDKDPKVYASRMQKRKEMGITFFQDGPAYRPDCGPPQRRRRARNRHR